MPTLAPKLLARATLAALIVGLVYQIFSPVSRPRANLVADAPSAMNPAAQTSVATVRHSSRRDLKWIIAAVAVFTLIVLGASAWFLHARESRIRDEANLATGGQWARAVPVMLANGCAGCHTISGVPAAQGKAGPPLDSKLSQKLYLAGSLPNNPENMIRWLRFSRDIDANTAMPSTGISEQEARDVAAYLYALR